jgi:hypothetical protein
LFQKNVSEMDRPTGRPEGAPIEDYMLEPQKPKPPNRTGSTTLVFHLAAREDVRDPSDVIELLTAAGITTGTTRARNPIMHDQWWIPVTALAAAGAPYTKGPRLGREGLAQRTPQPASAIGERSIESHGQFGDRRRTPPGRADQAPKEDRAPAGRQGAKEGRG